VGAFAAGTAPGLAVLCPDCLNKPAPRHEDRGCAGHNDRIARRAPAFMPVRASLVLDALPNDLNRGAANRTNELARRP